MKKYDYGAEALHILDYLLVLLNKGESTFNAKRFIGDDVSEAIVLDTLAKLASDGLVKKIGGDIFTVSNINEIRRARVECASSGESSLLSNIEKVPLEVVLNSRWRLNAAEEDLQIIELVREYVDDYCSKLSTDEMLRIEAKFTRIYLSITSKLTNPESRPKGQRLLRELLKKVDELLETELGKTLSVEDGSGVSFFESLCGDVCDSLLGGEGGESEDEYAGGESDAVTYDDLCASIRAFGGEFGKFLSKGLDSSKKSDDGS